MIDKKRADFNRLFPPRHQKVLDAIRVAAHCLKSHMDPDVAMLRDFRNDVDEAMAPFYETKWTSNPEIRPIGKRIGEPEGSVSGKVAALVDITQLSRKAEGGGAVEQEIRWAIDAIQRGDKKLAINRLRRCLGYADAED